MELLVSADDRTGALEVGGVLARKGQPVTVAPYPAKPDQNVQVVDIASRHLTKEQAAQRITEVHRHTASYHCHKMDSGLRGNWPAEARALVELGFLIAIVPSFPDAGRYCRDGVVYIQDVPVLESPFAQDPLTAPLSNRPAEILQLSGCDHPNIEVWDADDNLSLEQAVLRCLEEDRLLIGPTGAVACYRAQLESAPSVERIAIKSPVLIACGSLNATSRDQLQQLNVPIQTYRNPINVSRQISIIATDSITGRISSNEAHQTSVEFAETIARHQDQVSTLIYIGGDSVAAFLGDQSISVLGCVDSGIPAMSLGDQLLITKGGGIGTADTLVNLLRHIS